MKPIILIIGLSASLNDVPKRDFFLSGDYRVIDNNDKVLFVKHHIEHYDSQFPLWVVSELFTFGMISYFYNDLQTSDKKAIAGVLHKDMVSWLRCCTDLRNICAHYGKLFYRINCRSRRSSVGKEKERRLWGAIKALKALYINEDKWLNKFVIPLTALIEEYKDSINLAHIAFPEDWLEQLK